MIDGYTRTCGLFGNPVEHTMSPAIHNFLAEQTNINLVYVPFHVDTGYLEDAAKGAFALNCLGVNVTVPYKSDVIPYLCGIDPLAKTIGAVNTLVRKENGFYGYNTDLPGLLRAFQSDSVKIEGEKVLILGAGGVARAVAVLLAGEGAKEIWILNRTYERALEIAREVNALNGKEIVKPMKLSDWMQLPEGEKYLAIQTTNVGMYPQTESAVIEDDTFYEKIHTGYDLIFNPFVTKFMKKAKASGARAYNGLKMLLYQGIIAFELWNNISISEELALKTYDHLLQEMNKNIVLVGFMGCGKTSIGKALSQKLHMTMEDTDKLIEDKFDCSVSELFASKGEAYFRQNETLLLEELIGGDKNTVYSMGGGTPVNVVNRPLIRQLGKVVYLRVTPDTVYERLKDDTTRPLLNCADPYKKICTLLESRKEAYEECADLIVDVDGKTIEEIVQIICDLCR